MKFIFEGVRHMFAAVTLAVILVGSTKEAATIDPCSTTQNIGDAKRSTQNDPGVCNGLLCDNYIQQGPDQWYRLDGDTLGIRMPESCVKVWNCGTYIPVWMNGAHPTQGSPGPKSIRVCAQLTHDGDCCAWSDIINVKRCSDSASREYFVYQLKTLPFCDMAYCAGSGQFCPGDSAWNSLKGNCSSPKSPALPSDKPTLSDPYISAKKTVTVDANSYIATRFSVNCTLRHAKQTTDDGTRYEVIFEASDGQFIAEYTITPTNDTTVILDESKLVGFLDRKIRCKVTSYWISEYPVRREYISSDEKFIGIQVIEVITGGNRIVDSINQPLLLTEGLRNTIKFQATFPITSRACYDSPSSSTCNPVYQFRISAKGIKMSTCTFQLSPEATVSANLVVSPTYTIQVYGTYAGSMIIAAVNSIQSEGSVFKGYKSSEMRVTITDVKAPVYCKSTGDPHYTTFGNIYFHVFLVGDLYLVRLPDRNLEIQTRTTPCNINVFSMPVSCNCGVMVREGNNILGVDFCARSKPEYVRYLYDKGNPGGNISISSESFIIRLLSGIEIQGYFWSQSYIDIFVTGLGIENNDYGGICSYIGEEMQCTDQCNVPFSYRVPDADSLFRFSSSNPPKCKPSPIIPACDCSDNVPCFTPDQSNLKLTENTCNTPNGRTKRDGNDNQSPDYTTTDIDKLSSNFTIDLHFGTTVINLTWPTPINHIQKDDAQRQCESSLNMSAAAGFCIGTVKLDTNRIVQSCMYDIQVTDNIYFAQDSIAKYLETECGIQIKKFVSQNYTDPAANDLQSRLQIFLCPNQCSQKGTCTNGACVCSSGYMDIDCSIKQGEVPKVSAIQNSPCDIKSSACYKASISQSGALSKGSTCKIRDATGLVYYDAKPVVTDGWAYCYIQPTPVGNSNPLAKSTTNYTLSISISNDNRTYSDELLFVVYDGLCVECLTSQSCTQKTNITACNILGRCYERLTELPCKIGDVRTCNPDICANKWTYSTSRSCNEGIESCFSVFNNGRTVASGYISVMAYFLIFSLASFINFQN